MNVVVLKAVVWLIVMWRHKEVDRLAGGLALCRMMSIEQCCIANVHSHHDIHSHILYSNDDSWQVLD